MNDDSEDVSNPADLSPDANSSRDEPVSSLHNPANLVLNRGPQSSLPVPSKEAYVRFVGDLSPEASFLASRNNPSSSRNVSRHEYVGVWLGQKPQASSTNDHDGNTLPSLQALKPTLLQECIETIPPEYEYGLLSELYYRKIDPIFPILHGEILEKHSPVEMVALKQCICLVASLDPSLRKHLRLPQTEHILSQIEFRDRLAAAIKHSLDMGYLSDKVVSLQVCALMSFHVDKPECSEISSYYCAQAIHHSQGLGFHLGWPGDGEGVEKSQRIFWCVWVLDRLNAASNGRPILYHERDMDKTIFQSVDKQTPALRLLIRITQFLDETISLYRPHAEFPVQNTSTSFEEMVDGAGAPDIGISLLASLEMYYLSVVILRSRPNGPKGINRIPSSELQIYCASHIVSIASEEPVTYWPVMPYAVAMATSIAYKSLRNSIVPSSRKRAYALFHSSCEVLEDLGNAFLSARVFARLATETVQEVERLSGRKRSQAEDQHSRSVTQSSTGQATSSVPTLVPPTVPTAAGFTSPTYQFEGEAGIFTDFDPNFDLDLLDAVFSANLDPTMPMFPDWDGPNFG